MSYSRNVFIINDLTALFEKPLLIAQKQFVASTLILFVFLAIFRLADFLSDPFDFRLQKLDKKVAPSLH